MSLALMIADERMARKEQRSKEKLDNQILASDASLRRNAEALAEQIEAYWKARGFVVKTHLVELGFRPAMREVSYHVRSDMRNGVPKDFSPSLLQSATSAYKL